LGIGDWGLGPIPNPQSPIPNSFIFSLLILINTQLNIIKTNNILYIEFLLNKYILNNILKSLYSLYSKMYLNE